jgi:hypothetical protein
MKQILGLAALLIGYIFVPISLAEQPQAIGWIEHVQIHPITNPARGTNKGIILKAKIDTGADNSSIHAEQINIYEKDGEEWVKFSVKNTSGQQADFNLPLARYTMIKRRGVEPVKRPVVSMALCLGNTLRQVDINLANREKFRYPMLIGRSYLQDSLLVNSGQKYTVEPDCQAGNLANL